ncbi:XRE family transcriptional regulator [Burkholderia territorii]|uniref:XRE family transcriptional regulator n=1 Tax=Burkholderia territorii TaxID=1503055 RepID=UPI000A7BFE2E|nr:helix-turn-helix transcriptional regulator [Burkholderia territorii]
MMKSNTALVAPLSASVREVETFNSAIGERLRYIRTEVFRTSVADMASAFEVGTSTIQRYESGERTPDSLFLARVAERGSIDLSWLLYGVGNADGDVRRVARASSQTIVDVPTVTDTLGKPVDVSDFVFIPRYSVKAAAGSGQSVTDEAPTHTMAFRRYWIENYLHANPADLSVLSVKGDSQQGVLNDRDVILIDRSQTSGMAGLYVLRIDGEIIVKTLQRLPEGVLEVSSANPAYKPFTVNMSKPPSDFAIIGRVVWFGRQV